MNQQGGVSINIYSLSNSSLALPCSALVLTKEVNKEQPSYRNLSATATRVPQCTCPVAASWKDCPLLGIYIIINMIR